MADQFAKEQMEHLEEVYTSIVGDGKGFVVTTHNLAEVLRSFGQDPTDDEVQEMLDGSDLEANHVLSREDFLAAFMQDPSGDDDADLMEPAAQTASSVVTIKMPSPTKERVKLGKFRDGPKVRPPELDERDADRHQMHLQAGERSVWKPRNLPPEERENWSDRHHILFLNDSLNPNFRAYFDRTRTRRDDQLDELPGRLKTCWRLDIEPMHPDERQARKTMIASSGACAKPHLRDSKMEVKIHPTNFEEFPQIPGLHDPKFGQNGDSTISSTAVEAGSRSDTAAKTASTMTGATDSQSLPQSPSQSQTEWSNRHHITWCNERYTTGTPLNPVMLRSYFDRTRTPHNSRCEVPVKAQRLLPKWRLRTDPLTGENLMRSTMSSGSNISAAVDILKAPTRALPSKHSQAREKTWNTRHDLVFKNEEVSRLDRCYFDRWKEPEANLHAERTVRSLKPTWSLEKEGSPEKTAEKLMASSVFRHTHRGSTWSHRHQQTFCNDIHANLKSYFERPRDFPEMAGSHQRQKVTDKEKLKIDWSLGTTTQIDYAQTLRSESAPALVTTGQKKKAAPTWFSSHGVIF